MTLTVGLLLRVLAALVFLLKLLGLGAGIDLVVLGLLLWCVSQIVP